jgi:CubicO group peptidase (beta-lactamase class C family)
MFDSFSFDGFSYFNNFEMKFSRFLIKFAILIGGISALIQYIRSKRIPDDRIFVNGFVEPGWENVKEVFRENFAKNWERDGAALAVYYKGKPVVDLWGGFADLASERKWKEDTMSIAFSSTKAVGALCIALLIDRGNLQFNEKLVNFWPEFRKYGKDVITVEMIMAHTAGLAHLDEPITFEDAQNHERMSEIIENQKPHWNPGEKTGYHAVAYGWIVDQVNLKCCNTL